MHNRMNADIDREYQLYSLHLGHLVNTFGRMETLLMSALKLHLAMNIGSPTDVRAMQLAASIYGSMRFKAAKDTVKRILEVEEGPAQRRKIASEVFEQLAHIEDFRDKLAHQIVTAAHSDLGAFWQVSDHVTTRKLRSLKVWVFDTVALKYATSDLEAAAQLLGHKPVTNQLFDHLDHAELPKWSYKSSLLKVVPYTKLRWPPPGE